MLSMYDSISSLIRQTQRCEDISLGPAGYLHSRELGHHALAILVSTDDALAAE
jgi:hypothetical protein